MLFKIELGFKKGVIIPGQKLPRMIDQGHLSANQSYNSNLTMTQNSQTKGSASNYSKITVSQPPIEPNENLSG